jgi:hypothetical protein
MKKEYEMASLETLAGGKAIQQFDYELQKAVENITDPNTGDKERTVKLEVKLKPSPDRSQVTVSFQSSSKLAPDNPGITQLWLTRKGAKVQAFEYNPEQLQLELGNENQAEILKMIVEGEG